MISRRLEGLLHGDHLGLLPGHGSERAESREYRLGDDVRRMDWAVTARTTVPHVSDMIADRELTTYAVVDLTPSMHFGTHTWEKRDLALAATTAFGVLTTRLGSRFGLTVVQASGARGGVTELPPRSGRDSLRHALRMLAAAPRTEEGRRSPAESGSRPLNTALEQLGRRGLRRGLVVVVSDLLGDPQAWTRSMRALTGRHQVLVVEIRDPRELALPSVGVLALTDPETGAQLEVDTRSAGPARALRQGRRCRARRGRRGAASGARRSSRAVHRFQLAARRRPPRRRRPALARGRAMTYLAASRFWLLLLVAALLAGYVFVSLRRRRYAARFTQLSLLASVAPRRPTWYRRHVPAALLLLSMVGLVFSLARPAEDRKVPKERATIMLAIDVSESMAATDVTPSRLAAAKTGALAFVKQLPPKLQLGLVSFSGTAAVLVNPTTDRQQVRERDQQPAARSGHRDRRRDRGVAVGHRRQRADPERRQDPAAGPHRADLRRRRPPRAPPTKPPPPPRSKAHVPVSTIAYGTQNGTLLIQGQEVPVPVNTRGAAGHRCRDPRRLLPGHHRRRVEAGLSGPRQLDRLRRLPPGGRPLVHRAGAAAGAGRRRAFRGLVLPPSVSRPASPPGPRAYRPSCDPRTTPAAGCTRRTAARTTWRPCCCRPGNGRTSTRSTASRASPTNSSTDPQACSPAG